MKVKKISKAKLYFTETALEKMSKLIDTFQTEIAWHGIAKRGKSRGEYIISDILIYPQMVSGANVETDQIEYQKWLYEQPEDVFGNIRMQGHSHVNMAVFPSTTDLENQEKIINQLENDSFYIFIIANKLGDLYIEIYDFKYEQTFKFRPGFEREIFIDCLSDGTGFNKLYRDINKMICIGEGCLDDAISNELYNISWLETEVE